MESKLAAPCRNRGTPPPDVVDQIVRLLESRLVEDEQYLRTHGLTREGNTCKGLPRLLKGFAGVGPQATESAVSVARALDGLASSPCG